MLKIKKMKSIPYLVKTSLLLSLSSMAIAATDSKMDTIVVTASGF